MVKNETLDTMGVKSISKKMYEKIKYGKYSVTWAKQLLFACLSPILARRSLWVDCIQGNLWVQQGN